MRRPLFILQVVASISCVVLVLLSFAFSDEPNTQDVVKAEGSGAASLNLQLAKTRRDLAKVDLQRVLNANERIPATYSGKTVRLLRSNLDVAEARLKALSSATPNAMYAAYVGELESSLKSAELRLQAALRLQRSLPRSVDDLRLESRRLRVEAAKLALARAQDPGHEVTPQEQMQWQLDRVRQELLDLRVRLDDLSHRN